MITLKTKIQLFLFLVIALVGMSYVGVHYVGLAQGLTHSTYDVSADFPSGGGIYSGADVTYNGVHIGKVGKLQLLADGVRVQLIVDRSAPKIPDNARASVNDRSAVGEQYVDLEPAANSHTYLKSGAIIPMNRNSIPLSTPRLLLNVDELVNSVDRNNLSTVIDELGKAFSGRGQDLQRLIDAGNPLIKDAQAALPQTLSLLDVGKTVLDTQVRSRSDIAEFSKNLQLLSAQLKSNDPDIRRLATTGPDATNQVNDLLKGIRTDTGVLLANLLTTSEVTTRRLAGVEQILAVYPAAVAGGFTVAPGDGSAHFGLAINLSDPPACKKGYESTVKRSPEDGTSRPPNTNAGCTEPKGSVTDVRSAQNGPNLSGPEPLATIPPYARAHESYSNSGSRGSNSSTVPSTDNPPAPSATSTTVPPSSVVPSVPGLDSVPGIELPTIPGVN